MSEHIECEFSGDELQAFFLQAMVTHSWASGAKGMDVPDMPFHKETRFVTERLLLIDRYCVNQFGPMSSGVTTIFVNVGDTLYPVWVMNYVGWYEEEASRFVKRVLLYAYQQGKFNGGRGLDADNSSPPMKYRNVVDRSSSFEQFSGFEIVDKFNAFADHERICLGWHKYSGMLLLGKVNPHLLC